ncbi:MAG: transcriptional regulator [Bacteroidetes bacterium]|nr:transcriptional regulator [Bacteroidota bacterium]
MHFVINNEVEKVSKFLLQFQIHSDNDLDSAISYAEELTNVYESGNKDIEPLLDFLLFVIEKFEDEHYPVEKVSPIDMVKFLMDQHGHKQKDLTDIAPKSVISEILSGKRLLNKNHIEKLAEKYHVSPAVFF